MHEVDISLNHITKIEGTASLEVHIKDDRVEHVHFMIPATKRFYTQAIEGKPVAALPQLLARICGTCSSAHLICSIEAGEKALGIVPSEQSMMLRHLTMDGLIVRDHALHLYLFVMPDLYGKDAFLDFDENDPVQHQLLEDAFAIKAAGNYLATIVSGRAVHAMHPTIGGFLHFPSADELKEAVKKLKAVRPAVLRLIKIFEDAPWTFDRKTNYMALVTPGEFSFLEGEIVSNRGDRFPESEFRNHLEHVVLPYSMASAYTHQGDDYMVGALARLNLEKDILHPDTRASLGNSLNRFPSTNIFDNNLAQAIEILQSIDHAIGLIESHDIKPETIIKQAPREGVGVGVIEAPRGILYHKVEIDGKGIVTKGEIVVPTGQNQRNIEEDVHEIVNNLYPKTSKEKILHEIEKLIRAYDPCISCATHFLKVDWRKE